MKGKVLSIITAILFGATMLACPVVNAAGTDDTMGATGTEEQAPEQAPAPAKKKPAKKKKATKKAAKKKTAKKKTSKKKKAAKPAPVEETE